MTQNVAFATEMQLTRDAFAHPSATPTAYLTPTPELAPVGVISGIVYAQGSVNVRECPRTDCERVGALTSGQSVEVTGMIDGEAVVAGDTLWLQVKFGGREGYVYAQYTTDDASDTITSVQIPNSPTFDEASYIAAINSKLGLRNIVSVRVADGRPKDGERVAIIAYITTNASAPNFVNEWVGFYTDIAAAIRDYQLDIDRVDIIIAISPDVVLGTLDATVADIMAYSNGQIDRATFIARISFVRF
jgi:uncharacterized protein YraI